MKPLVSTFSIIGFDPEHEQLGVAVQSKFFAVGTTVTWVQAGVGAVATQAFANIEYGPRGLELLAGGKAPSLVVQELVGDDANAEIRQVAVMDANGQVAAHTGRHCMPWAGHIQGHYCTVQGNILVGSETVRAMVRSFEQTDGAGTSLAERLVAALAAGQEAGGDRRGRQSAALLVGAPGDKLGEHHIDIRVDDHPQPIRELGRLLGVWKAFYEGMLATDLWIPLNEDIMLVLQAGLRRSGYLLPADVTGNWSEAFARSLEEFAARYSLPAEFNEDRVSGELFRAVFEAYQRPNPSRRN